MERRDRGREGDLEEIPSSDDDDDMDASELRGRLQKLTARGAGIESPEYTSPVGSPPEDSVLSAKGRFMELKRMMQQDKKSRRSKRKGRIIQSSAVAVTERDPDIEGFEEIEDPDEDWEREGSISPASYHDDVEQLLESFRSERAGERDRDHSVIAHRFEHHPRMMEVCQQLRERDQNILSLEGKVMELDRQIIDLQDTLSEKEKLLNSKNDAVNCMVNQYQQSIADRDVELSKTQETLFELERKFGSVEKQWKTEKDRLNAEIKQQCLRIKDLEDTNKLLEDARVEQTSRDIELEEKLFVLKQDRDRLTQDNVTTQSLLDKVNQEKGELEQGLNEKTEEFDRTVKELRTETETSANKTKEEYEAKLTKIKKQFSIKLKAIKESAAEATEIPAVQELQTQLNELLEKLNTKAQETEMLQTHNTALQNELQHLKIQLLEISTAPKDTSEETELLLQITTLQNRTVQLETENATLASVEEELSKLKHEAEATSNDFNGRLAEYEKNFERAIEDYEQRLERQDQLEKNNQELTAALEKSKEQLNKMKKQFQAKLKAARDGQQGGNADSELQAKYNALEQRVAELEEENGNNLWIQEELTQLKQEKEVLKVEHEATILNYRKQLEDLNCSLDKTAEQISLLESQQQSPQSNVNFFTEASFGDGGGWESQTRITALEHQVAELEEEKGSGFLVEEDIGRLKMEREMLENDFRVKSSDYEAKIQQLEEQLTKSTEQMAKMKRQFQIKLKTLRDEKAKDKEENSSSRCPESEIQLLAKITSLENRVAELEEEKENGWCLVDFDEQQAQRTVTQESDASSTTVEDTIRLEIALSEREEELRQLHNQLSELTSALSQKNAEVEQLMRNCSDLEHSLQQNIEELSTSISTKDDEISTQISGMESQLAASVVNLSEKEAEIQSLNDKLIDTETRFEEMQSLMQEYQGMVEGVRGHDKEELSSLKEELESIREKAETSEQSFESMKAFYTEETNQCNSRLAELEQEIEKLQQNHEEKCRSYDVLKEKHDKNESDFVTQIETLSAQLASYEIEIERLRSNEESNMQTVDLQGTPSASDFEEKEKEFKRLEEQLMDDISSKNDQIQSLNYQLENAKFEASNLRPLREENERFKDELGKFSAYSESLKTELESLRNYYTTLEANYNQVYTEFMQKSEQLEHLMNTEAGHGSLISSLQTEIIDHGSKFAALQSTTSELEQNNSKLTLQVEQLSIEGNSLRSKLTGMTNEYIQLRESLESKDTETQRLRQDADTLQTEYSHSNNELKLKISSLMDQLNDCETEISVVANRLKESDEINSETRTKLENASLSLEQTTKFLEEKSKMLEQAENSLFEKTEENLKLEDKLKEIDQQHKLAIEANFVKYSDDLDVTYDQLALTASENITLQEKLRKKEEELEDVIRQLQTASSNTNHEVELNQCRDRIYNLESQLTLSSQQFAELKAQDDQQSARVQELLQEIEIKSGKLTELSVELEELKNTVVSTNLQSFQNESLSPSVQSLWGPPPTNLEDPFSHIQNQTAAECSQAEAQTVLESQIKDLRIQELEAQVMELAVVLEESRKRQESEEPAQLQNLWGPPPPYQHDQLCHQNHDPFAAISSGAAVTDENLANPVNQQQQDQRDQRIYDLEVQLAEMQITVDDANMQLSELTELNTSLEILSYKIKELEDENSKMKLELEHLNNLERSRPTIDPFPSRIQIPEIPGSGTPFSVEEPIIVPSTAYITTEQSSAALEIAAKEIKELKVKNGKMIQRFKQLKDKFDAVVKENEGYKTKKEFSLDSAFEEEFMSQVKAKDSLLEEKGKQLIDLQTENKRLVEKVDLLERGTERLTEMKEEQDRQVQSLANNKRSLETEVSALKWKMEELENISLSRAADFSSTSGTSQELSGNETQNQGYFDLDATNSTMQENSMLRQQNLIINQELENLRREIDAQKKLVDELHERNQQLEEEIEKLQELQIDQRILTPASNITQQIDQRILTPASNITQQTPNEAVLQPSSLISSSDVAVDSFRIVPPTPSTNNQQQTVDTQLSSLQNQLYSEQQEKVVLERKIELLQSKISEVEISEIKCFEESLMLKSWTRQLELDNLKVQRELERIYASIQDGETGSIKVKVLQDEVIRLVDALHDRDKRCEQLTVEITRLLEERDTLQLKLSNVLRHNVSLHEEVNKGRDPDVSSSISDIPSYDKEALKLKLAELEEVNFSMGIDLRREREARRLVQEQLFFSSSSRIYPGSSGGNRSPQSVSPGRSRTPTTTTPTPQLSPSIPPPPAHFSTPTPSPMSHQPEQLTHSPKPHQEKPVTTFVPSPMTSAPVYDLPFQQKYLQPQQPQDSFNYPSLPLQPPVQIPVPPESSNVPPYPNISNI